MSDDPSTTDAPSDEPAATEDAPRDEQGEGGERDERDGRRGTAAARRGERGGSAEARHDDHGKSAETHSDAPAAATGAPRDETAATVEWVATARGLRDARADVPKGWQRIAGSIPPVLDGDGVRGLVAPLVAAVAWLGAAFREVAVTAADPSADASLDPLALFMRLFGIGLSVRAAILFAGLIGRLRVGFSARSSYLVLAPEGLFAMLGRTEVALARREIVGIVEPGAWHGRRTGRRWAPVYVVGSSAERVFLALPPIFEASPGILAELLMRWRGVIEEPETPQFPEPPRLASKTYDDAARGMTEPGTLVVRHGDGWLRRGPYAALLLAVAVADGFLRADVGELSLGPVPALAVPALALVVAAAVPIGWVLLTRREIAPRRGIALVLTPAELLLRARSGVVRTAWPNLLRVTLDSRLAWSVLEGVHRARSLVLKRRGADPVTYDEAFLGVPAEVAQTLLDAYRRGVLLAHAEARDRLEARSP